MSAIEITVKRYGGNLVPTAPMFLEDIEAIPTSKEVMCSLRMARNVAHHRKMFGLLNAVIQAGYWDGDIDSLVEWLKIATGLVSTVIGQDDKIYHVLKSIKFESMDQLRFNRFYDRALYVMSERWGVDVETLGRRAQECAADLPPLEQAA